MKELIGKKVYQTVELNVNGNLKVFGEVLKETKFKTGNKAITLKVEGVITNATANSIEVKSNKWTENGVDAYNWYEKSWFDRTFTIEK